MNTVNTRIILRNDALSNWISANPVLSTGEVALARREDGTYDLRIGYVTAAEGGEPTAKTFNELSSSLMLSSHQIIGLDDEIKSLSTTHYEVADLTDLTGNYTNGDTAVVKQLIGVKGETSSYSYTAYVFDSKLSSAQKPNGDWAAMDGNYNASNVYFDENLTYTAAIGAIGTPAGGMGTISSAGMNLEDLLKTIMNKEQSGTTTQPSVTVNTNTSTVEYGSTQNPAYSFTFNHGNYQYGPSPTGVSLTKWEVKTDGNALDVGSYTGDNITQTQAACNPSQITATFESSALTANIYQISASATHTAGDTPKTNMGNDDPDASKKIIAGTKTASKYIYKVYKPTFWKVTTTPTADITAGSTSELTSSGWNKLEGTLKTSYSCSANWYEIFFLMPAGQKNSWSGKDSNNVDIAVEPKKSVTFTYANGTTADYDLFIVRNAAPYAATTVTMTFA